MQAMLAIFDSDFARAPTGLQRTLSDQMRRTPSHDEREASKEWRDSCLSRLPSSKRMILADGIDWSYSPSTYCHYAECDGVHAMFSGEITEWPGIDIMASMHDAFVRGEPESPDENDASWLLKFYETFKECEPERTMPSALAALSRMKGRFAWIIYDAGQRRVLAARDRSASVPLYWGCTPDDEHFMIGTDVDYLRDCLPSATAFPAGSLFSSAGHSRAVQSGPEGWVMPGDLWPGQVRSFVEKRDHTFRNVRVVPRVNSRGALCGAVYRVASELDLSNEGPATIF